MYLKSIELVGFKSFAEKTCLEFEPGMTAIVGPNGCGKSNVADAIRWVLGEQSARAMRGAKMEDVIFTGTDSHKPLGMAEVSMTLADCESTLGMEFNEVTVTRRVFRSGEGQYFINKAPCRLKDIQRLFMDTGIGTNSYSLMEQGRIDKILSSHPEDRRAVFEEASGITKYKTDKKEALRKMEQTEANLLRLDDIIREVKRQIISLQRQAGKARRYQTLQQQLRSLDLFATRERLATLDAEIKTLESRMVSVSEQDEAVRQDIDQTEERAGETRAALAELDKQISDTMDAAVKARTELDRVKELMRHNEDRIQELQSLSERDTRDAEEAKIRMEQHQASFVELGEQLGKTQAEFVQVEKELADHAARLTHCEQEFEDAGKLIHRLRTEQIDHDMHVAKLQNELSTLDAEERTNVIRRERLAAELNELQRSLELYSSRQAETCGKLNNLRGEAANSEEQLRLLLAQQADKSKTIASIRQSLSEQKVQFAGKQAQCDLFQQSQEEREGFPEGARTILDPAGAITFDRTALLGTLAELLRTDHGYHIALETVLRPWLDAIVVNNDTTVSGLLKELEALAVGSARVLAAETAGASARAPSPQPPGSDPLINHVRCADNIRPLLERLIGNVYVVRNASELPNPVPHGVTFVTLNGAMISSDGTAEFWKRDNAQANPLARQQLLADWQTEIDVIQLKIEVCEASLAALTSEESSVTSAIAQARTALEESRRKVAVADGENQVISQEAQQAAERVETVSWEVKSLSEQHHSGDDRRAAIISDIATTRKREDDIRSTISTKTEEQRDLEQRRSRALSEVTERRVRFSECRQRLESNNQRREQMAARIEELESLIEERSRGVSTYRSRIDELKRAVAESTGRIQPLEAEVAKHNQVIDETRGRRDILNGTLRTIDLELRDKRAALEEIRTRKTQCEVEIAEQRMRHQNQIDRVTGEYRATLEAVLAEPEPQWENGVRPDRDALETSIAEIRAKLEAMGPVNLVAIEEHKELEDRLNFLTIQQTDLVNSKQQLMDMIREINKKTTEMFQQTFDAVNKNFQEMFTKLFGGGTAKLVLVDEADVLESGIEIIARPPGKKLQTVSLLSGGERTMTAVALLFSLYLVKPSPFCVLDELDAALDEANIGRFVKTVQGFVEKSQFVVITHNRQTIAAAGVLYGVTMEQQGVSKIVSVRFNDGETKQPPPPPPSGGAGPAPLPAPEPAPATA
ncbi:MAG: chromosome segregation protein SMC [bacterium]